MRHFTHKEQEPWPIGTVLKRINYGVPYIITVLGYELCEAELKPCMDCTSDNIQMECRRETGDISRFCISRRGSNPFWVVVK